MNSSIIGEDKNRKGIPDSERYFTPSIEDIRVGYECEINAPAWIGKKFIVDENQFQYVVFCVNAELLKVPYLTKEQIEAEGWKVETQPLGNYIRGTKKCLVKDNRMGKNWDYNIPVEFQITYDIKNYILKIMYINSIDDLTWFEGECKDINTFRYIIKLLGI